MKRAPEHSTAEMEFKWA